jgi:hypothetical protein
MLLLDTSVSVKQNSIALTKNSSYTWKLLMNKSGARHTFTSIFLHVLQNNLSGDFATVEHGSDFVTMEIAKMDG